MNELFHYFHQNNGDCLLCTIRSSVIFYSPPWENAVLEEKNHVKIAAKLEATSIIIITFHTLYIYPYVSNTSSLHFLFLWLCNPTQVMASSFLRFLDHTRRRTTVGRTPLDEWSARHRDLYLTTHKSQQTNMHAPGGIQTHNLSRRADADLRLRPSGYWDRRLITLLMHLPHNIHEENL